MKWPAVIILLLVTGVMAYGVGDLPSWGDPESPASVHVSPRYIEKSFEETHTENMVTAVIGDYRGYDTLFEMVVIFTAGLACVLILAEARKT